MDESFHKSNPNPKATAGIFSTATFLYTIPTYKQGVRKGFTEDDIYETLPELKADNLGSVALKLWSQQLEKFKCTGQSPSLLNILVKIFWKRYLLLLVLFGFIELGPRILIALAVGELINTYGSEDPSNTYIYAFFLILCSFSSFSMIHPYYIMCSNAGLRVQIVCSTLIYNKIMKLSQTALRQTTPGQVINLLSNDISTFENFFNFTHVVWTVPIQIAVVLYLTYREVGISGILGTSLIFLFVPLHYLFGRLISKYRLRTSIKRDERIRLTNEIIQGINIIKMYAWEKPFAAIVAKCRKLEIDSITLSLYVKGVFSMHTTFVTTSIFICIISTSFFERTITAKNAFIVIALYTTLGSAFMLFFPQGIASVEEARVSIKRISDFLQNDEISIKNSTKKQDHAVSIKSGSAKWDQNSKRFTFENLNCEIQIGSLTMVVGPVGSGKSSFLQVILQELPLLNGNLGVNGTISYSSQEPWLFSSSIRNNILFGSRMEEDRYRNVVKCCALDHDFKLFPYGDATTIGERGTSLSGGQKARINLARAVYREADIYLLDDPLSAVDIHVGKQIFEDCIQTFLKNKTIILITHQVQYLKYVDHIIILNNGSITAEGSPSALETTGVDFARYIQDIKNENTDEVNTIEENDLDNNNLKSQAPKVQAEGQSTGTMPLRIYKDYIFISKSYAYALLAFMCFTFTQVFTSLSFSFVAYWVKSERESHSETYGSQRNVNIYIYTTITLVAITFTILRTLTYVNLSMKSSKKLHDSMFNKVVHASSAFFNNNPSGRILNRFAKDLGMIDEILPNTATIAFRTLFTALGNVVVICVINPSFIIPTIIIVIVVYFMRKIYLLINLNVVRVESITRSPIYGHANTTLAGLPTIRAFCTQESLIKQYYAYQDQRSSAYYLALTISRSFSYFTDVVCFAYITTLTIYFILTPDWTGEKIGLAITQAVQIMGLLPYSIRHMSEIENCMISVERILEYDSAEQERSVDSSEYSKLPANWPEHGKIVFDKVFLRYNETEPYVLKNLNFTIESKEKVGIVGRTGAGKSSIINTLFQLVNNEGTISIDDIDIKKIGLHDLRRKMSIIPQDPALFAGVIRKNLDPFDEFSDDALWKALEEVRLKDIVDNMGSGLNSEVLQNGANLSVGQRQLICLARAIIRNNKILILDEATANVDLKTDEIIQETIRNNFSKCTVITVAHRLNTIMDSDKIVVISAGEVVEFDHPHLLLQNKQSIFYKMVQETDVSIAKALMDIAYKSFQQKICPNGTNVEKN